MRLVSLLCLAIAIIGYSIPASGKSTSPVLVGAGDIASCDPDRAEATAKLLDKIAGTVFTAGDNAYSGGAALQIFLAPTPAPPVAAIIATSSVLGISFR